MKTTVDVPDSLYRQIKARAALQGKTVKAFFLDALRDKLAGDKSRRDQEVGWRSVFGKASKAEIEELERIVNEDRSRVDPEDWA